MGNPEFSPYTELKETLGIAAKATGKLVSPAAEGISEVVLIYFDAKFRGNKTYHMLRPLIGTCT